MRKISHTVMTNVHIDGVNLSVSISQKGLRISRKTPLGKQAQFLEWDLVIKSMEEQIEELKQKKLKEDKNGN